MSHYLTLSKDLKKPDAIHLFEKVWRETVNEGVFDRGLWKSHSYHVADGAARIAEKLPSADPDRAFALGLLHDIGKSIDYRPKKHALTGYQFLLAHGYTEAALVALTHDFPTKEFEIHRQEGFLETEELDVVIQALSPYEYTLYDRIIQVCDVISLPEGHVLNEWSALFSTFLEVPRTANVLVHAGRTRTSGVRRISETMQEREYG